MSPFLSIVIPAFNEAERLPATLNSVFTYLDSQTYSAEVLVVENGSEDKTLEVARTFEKDHPTLRVIHEAQRGKGLAVRRGMLESSGEYRFICDADLSMPIETLERFLPPLLENFDIAIGSREIAGAVRYNEPFYRHLLGRGFNTLVRVMAVPGFQDTQAGFKCFHATAAEELFKVQTLDGMSFDVEVIYVGLRRGYRIVEVPIPWYFNADSRVRVISDSLGMFRDLFRIRRNWKNGLYGKAAGDTDETPSEV